MRDAAAACDHLMLGAPDLEQGIRWLEALTGVRAGRGGSHPRWGTHNALISLGPRQYLEILAPDPAQPEAGSLFAGEARRLAVPRLIHWMAAAEGLAGAEPGSRIRPDGTVVRWKLLDAGRGSALLPFLIEWDAGSPHPAQEAPAGCTLRALRFESRDPGAVSRALQGLEISAEVSAGPADRIVALLDTPRGAINLG
jgi:hypothetical protein